MKKKPLLITLLALGASGLLLGGSLKPNQNVKKEVTSVSAYSIEDLKNEAKYELENYVNLDECSDELREKVIEIVSRACVEIDNATREYDVNCIWSYSRQCLDDLLAEYADPEARELNIYKQARIDYIQEHIDVDSYSLDIRQQLQNLIDNCIGDIEYAESKEEVDEYYNAFIVEFTELTGGTSVDIATKKANSIAEIELTANGYEFKDFYSSELNKLVNNSIALINQAMTASEVDDHVADFRTEFAKLPTSSSDLGELRKTLIKRYNDYEGERVTLTGFVDTYDQLVPMYETFEEEIMNAPSVQGILFVYSTAIAALDELMPFDDILKAKNNAISYIDARLYPEFAWCFQYELDRFVPEIKQTIQNAETVEEINAARGTFDYEISFFPSDVESYLTETREELRIEFINYYDDRMHEENKYLDEDTLKALEQGLVDGLEETSVNKELYDVYQSAIRTFEEILKGEQGTINPTGEDPKPEEPAENKSNTGLIVACSVEGGVILLGGALALFMFLKKKRV